MEVLVLGYSSLVKRRVLSSLLETPEITQIHIGSRGQQPHDLVSEPKRGLAIRGYGEALEKVDKNNLVYISLPNKLHYEWAKNALDMGHHVIVDKPSFVNLWEAEELSNLADKKSLCLAEANVWTYHPMHTLIERYASKEGQRATFAEAYFNSPALPPENFRLQPQPGSGIIYDRASYAITAGRLVFQDEPSKVECQVVKYDDSKNVDLNCSITLHYPGERVFKGTYSLDSEYKNRLEVRGKSYTLEFKRVFTPPEDYTGPATLRRGELSDAISFEPANTFRLFFSDVINSIVSGQFRHFSERLLLDSQILDKILAASRGGH